MKFAKQASRILALGFGLAMLAMFFFQLVAVTGSAGVYRITGAQLAFGGSLQTVGGGAEVGLFKSAYYTFAFLVAALGALLSALSFKWKRCSIASLVSGIVSIVLMLLFACSKVGKYVDSRPIAEVTEQSYLPFFWLCLAFTIAFTAFTVAAILIADYLEALASKGAKKTIIKRFFAFLREYKSELKKVTWPNFRSVAKNTAIVLIMCLVIGAFIWLLDLGLGQLLKLLLQLD